MHDMFPTHLPFSPVRVDGILLRSCLLLIVLLCCRNPSKLHVRTINQVLNRFYSVLYNTLWPGLGLGLGLGDNSLACFPLFLLPQVQLYLSPLPDLYSSLNFSLNSIQSSLHSRVIKPSKPKTTLPYVAHSSRPPHCLPPLPIVSRTGSCLPVGVNGNFIVENPL